MFGLLPHAPVAVHVATAVALAVPLGCVLARRRPAPDVEVVAALCLASLPVVAAACCVAEGVIAGPTSLLRATAGLASVAPALAIAVALTGGVAADLRRVVLPTLAPCAVLFAWTMLLETRLGDLTVVAPRMEGWGAGGSLQTALALGVLVAGAVAGAISARPAGILLAASPSLVVVAWPAHLVQG